MAESGEIALASSSKADEAAVSINEEKPTATGERKRKLECEEKSQDLAKKTVVEKAHEVIRSSLQKRRNGKRPMIVVLYHRKRGRNGVRITKEGEVTLQPYGGVRNTCDEEGS